MRPTFCADHRVRLDKRSYDPVLARRFLLHRLLWMIKTGTSKRRKVWFRRILEAAEDSRTTHRILLCTLQNWRSVWCVSKAGRHWQGRKCVPNNRAARSVAHTLRHRCDEVHRRSIDRREKGKVILSQQAQYAAHRVRFTSGTYCQQ